MKKLTIFFIFILFFSCTKKENTQKKEFYFNNLKIDFKLPQLWQKDKELDVYRDSATGASFSIEVEESKLDLDTYVTNSINLVKKFYIYDLVKKKERKIGEFKTIDIEGILHSDSVDIFVHNIIIAQDNLKINISISFDSEKKSMVIDDYKFILNSLGVKNANNK